MMLKHIKKQKRSVTEGLPKAKKRSLNLNGFSDSQLTSYFEALFKIGDKDGNGFLDVLELKALLSW